MKIKMKVKTLMSIILGSLFIVLIILSAANFGIAKYLSSKGSDKAEMFYEKYLSSPIKINEKQGLYSYAENLVKGFHKYTIKFNGWGGGERTTPENMERAMELFEEVLLKDEKNNYENDYSIQSYYKLLDTSIATLDMDELLYWIEWGKDKENMEIKNMSKLYESYYYFVQKDYIRAKEILEGYNKEEPDMKYYSLMGDINLHLGNIEKAREYYEIPMEGNFLGRESDFGGSDLRLNMDGEINDYIDKSQGEYKIRGKVSYNGKSLPFIEVYLSEYIGMFRTSGAKPDAITDENGEFETLGLKQGVYEIGIGLHPSQLYNKVFLNKDIRSIELNSDMNFDFTFTDPMEIESPKENITLKDGEEVEITWEKVEGADYYVVESLVFTNPKEKSGSMFTTILTDKSGEDRLKKNNIVINMESLDKRIGGLSFEGEEEIVSSNGILGSFIPKVEYPIVVKAYDKEENLIGSSLPLISDYRETISIEIEGELTEGEELILDKKYEKAISYYEEKLKENSKDEESLLYLSRFYMIGWKKDKKDFTKALKYASEYDKLNGNSDLSMNMINFIRYKDIIENSEEVKRILDSIPEENRDTSYYREKGRYHLSKEEFSEARESYEKMTDYKPSSMIYIDMYLEDYEKAISTLESGEIEFMKLNTKKVIEALRNMDNVSREDKELFKELLESVLVKGLSTEQEKNIYDRVYSSVESKELEYILQEMSKEEYWDR